MTPDRVLASDLLLAAYRQGWFPMGERATARVEWFSPDPRGILPLDQYRVPRRLARLLRRRRFHTTVDTAFPAVIHHCAAQREETWISEPIVASFLALHRQGFAHSIEVWLEDALVGGLYGVALGGAFFGESMFHGVTDASKVALDALVVRLRARRFSLLDVQWVTPHLKQFGAIDVSRNDYLRRLARAQRQVRAFA